MTLDHRIVRGDDGRAFAYLGMDQVEVLEVDTHAGVEWATVEDTDGQVFEVETVRLTFTVRPSWQAR